MYWKIQTETELEGDLNSGAVVEEPVEWRETAFCHVFADAPLFCVLNGC